MIWAGLIVLLVCIILLGARLGGIGLDTVAALGLSLDRGEFAGKVSATEMRTGAVVMITMLGLMPGLRPDFMVDRQPEKLSMVFSISLITLAATALILFVSKAKPTRWSLEA